MNILLDYFFPIVAITPTPQASTAFLKQVCIVVKPKGGVDPLEITLCTTMSQVSALTDNLEAQQLFNAGMSRVYVLTADDLDLADVLAESGSDFYTLLISSDFDDADIEATLASRTVNGDLIFTAKEGGVQGNEISITLAAGGTAGAEVVTVVGKAISISMATTVSTANQIKAAMDASPAASALVTTSIVPGEGAAAQAAAALALLENGDGMFLGTFKGVVGVSSADDEFLAEQAAVEKRSAFHTDVTNKAKNMFYAFGKLLSNPLSWLNQQYITMPLADDVDVLGEATNLFDSKISFVISDSEFGNRLGLFAAGGKAIVAPYITKNLEIDIQSRALSYISGNQPGYTRTQAALLEDELQKVITTYVDRQYIEEGVVEVKLEQQNFVASGYINISEPNALWRIFGEIRQTL